ncbi:MAG: recombinase family protein, partial [Desulfovibrionales bacterium]|nr:recombinase family protein [Desulfovibrionales bacterium]
YAQQHNLHIDDWYRLEISSRKNMADRKIDELLSQLSEGDTLLVAELSRLGRSLSQIVFIIDALIAKGVIFIAVKQRIHLNGEHDMTTKISTTLFALMCKSFDLT